MSNTIGVKELTHTLVVSTSTLENNSFLNINDIQR